MWKPVVISFDESDDEGLSYIYFDLKIEKHIDIEINIDIDMVLFRKTLENIFLAKNRM